jgi:hypothetical protein
MKGMMGLFNRETVLLIVIASPEVGRKSAMDWRSYQNAGKARSRMCYGNGNALVGRSLLLLAPSPSRFLRCARARRGGA